jgi:N,N'-diacetyllegionaminate synthase
MSNKIFLIAEIGVNHNGDMQLAKKMIDAAKSSGADAVKFQTFTAKALVSQGTPKVRYQESTTSPEETHYEMIQKLELKRADHFFLKTYCEEVGIEFLSTPYDIDSAKFLHEELDVRLFKTASADIVDLPLHQYIASTGKHSMVSVGMATLGEVEDVVNIYRKFGNQNLTLLHCVSNYPCSDESLNLNVITTLKDAFQLQVGYSDHSVGLEASVLSVALGVTIIEKHFTLDKKLPGPDHLASSTPEEFALLKNAVRRAENMLGSPIKRCQEEEKQMASVSRKSIVAARNIQVGDVIDFEDIVLKRPGTGIKSIFIDFFVGKKAKRRIEMGQQISFEDIS